MNNFKTYEKNSVRLSTAWILSLVVLLVGVLSLVPLSVKGGTTSSLEKLAAFSEELDEMEELYSQSTIELSDEEYQLCDDQLLVSADVVESYSLFATESDEEGLYSVNFSTSDDGAVCVTSQNNRLIVYYDGKISDCGAIMSASYKNWKVFQYDSIWAAQEAYEYYESLGINVSYDQTVGVDYIDEDEDEENSSSSATSTSSSSTASTSTSISANSDASDFASKSFNTWGQSYVGYSDFVAQIFEQNAVSSASELPVVYVAVLDSGIYKEHTVFYDSDGNEAGRIATDYAISYVTDSGTKYKYEDKYGHGTHVSGTIAELTLDNVQIIPVKVLGSTGSGSVGDIVQGIEDIIALKEEKGLNIVAMNMSIGVDTSSGGSYENSALKTCVVDAYEAGIISCVSAGNSGIDAQYACPANVSCAFTVSALTEGDGSKESLSLAYYSNYGSYIDFAAPGTSITSAWINGGIKYTKSSSGTSMAAPHVTAAVALVYSNPLYASYTPDQVYNLLVSAAYDIGDEGFDESFGYGLIYIGEIGVNYDGYVSFSEASGEKEGSISLTLSYTPVYAASSTPVIYYSTDEDVTSFSLSDSSWKQYTGAITISSTTRVSAVATYTSTSQESLKSYFKSQEYYFDGVDFDKNFTFSSTTGGYAITAYNGILTTLKVPSTYEKLDICEIAAYALSGTSVEALLLPSTITTIDAYAFAYNTTIEDVSFYSASTTSSSSSSSGTPSRGNASQSTATSSNLDIGNYAFYKCTNATFDFSNVTIESVGDYSFAYCSNLDEIQLMDATKIGKHAFSVSGLSSIWIGKNVTSIGTHSSMNLQTVYGYSGDEEESVSQIFAQDVEAKFVDLTLSFSQDLDDFVIVGSDDEIVLSVEFVGYGASIYAASKSSGLSYYTGNINTSIEQTKTDNGGSATITLTSSADGTYTFCFVVKDYYSESLSGNVSLDELEDYGYVCSNTITILVTDDTYSLTLQSAEEENYSISITNQTEDGEIAASSTMQVSGQSTLLQKSATYCISIQAESGYKITSVLLNGEEQISDAGDYEHTSFDIENFSSTADATLVVETAERESLNVYFSATNGSLSEYGNVYVSGDIVSAKDVSRGDSLSFSVVPYSGYSLSRVVVNDEVLKATNGVYTISNVTEDMTVYITFTSQANIVRVSYGVGGTVSWSGNSTLAYGDEMTCTITPYSGYTVASVTLNGEEVELTETSTGQYTFTVTNLSEDEAEVLSVQVSFKKTSSNFFSGSAGYYFIVFLVLFAVFAVASVVLKIVRKKKHTQNKLASH